MKKKIIIFVTIFLIISFGLGIFTGYGPIPDLVKEKLGIKSQNLEKNFDSYYYENDFSSFVLEIERITGDVLLTSPNDFKGVLDFLTRLQN